MRFSANINIKYTLTCKQLLNNQKRTAISLEDKYEIIQKKEQWIFGQRRSFEFSLFPSTVVTILRNQTSIIVLLIFFFFFNLLMFANEKIEIFGKFWFYIS